MKYLIHILKLNLKKYFRGIINSCYFDIDMENLLHVTLETLIKKSYIYVCNFVDPDLINKNYRFKFFENYTHYNIMNIY